MEKILIWECSNKIGVKNVEFVLDLLQSLNGKEIEEFIKEPAYAMVVVNKKIFVKSVP
jgi:hypothetical protein